MTITNDQLAVSYTIRKGDPKKGIAASEIQKIDDAIAHLQLEAHAAGVRLGRFDIENSLSLNGTITVTAGIIREGQSEFPQVVARQM